MIVTHYHRSELGLFYLALCPVEMIQQYLLLHQQSVTDSPCILHLIRSSLYLLAADILCSRMGCEMLLKLCPCLVGLEGLQLQIASRETHLILIDAVTEELPQISLVLRFQGTGILLLLIHPAESHVKSIGIPIQPDTVDVHMLCQYLSQLCLHQCSRLQQCLRLIIQASVEVRIL